MNNVMLEDKPKFDPNQNIEIFTHLSHEIRNPLSAIIGISELLKMNNSEVQREEYYKILHSTSENLLELVNNILDFSKLKSGTLGLTPREFSFREKLSDCLHSQKQAAISKSVRFNLNFDEEIPDVLIGDQVKIVQVFINLVSNSIKFCHTGEINISVDTKYENEDLIILESTIQDTGIGIPANQLDKIFQAFHQGDEDINITYAGTGLGLSITRDLIKMLGGCFQIESRINHGTAFKFFLPFDKPNKLYLYPKKKELNILSLKGKKVLLVEDNTINVLVVSRFLQLWEMDIDTANNGEEAMIKIINQEYDIVLMDLYMPKMTGDECVRRIRKLPNEKFRKLPIIALTADVGISNQQNFSVLFNGLISKPFESGELYEILCANCK